MTIIRVAAAQFAVTGDVAGNLATSLRMIDRAAAAGANLIVLPEFINHIMWFDDAAHCYRTAVELESDFLAAIGRRAAQHACYVKVNCTVRRPAGQVTGTNILFDPRGRQIAVNDKQILMGNENNFLVCATERAPVVETAVGRLGMLCCMDGVIPEPARSLAVRGAQILLNSLNSFAEDEASLHIPVRAAENKVFVVAANKVGLLVPPAMADIVAARMNISPDFLHGAGESQIVAPDGTVLARAPKTGEAVVWADIDVSLADDKRRPDGSDILRARRPALYCPLAQPPQPRRQTSAAAQIEAAVWQPRADRPAAVDEAVAAVVEAAAQGVSLLALPELVHLSGGVADDLAAAAAASDNLLARLQAALDDTNTDCLVAATVVTRGKQGGYRHDGVLISRAGIVLRQPQLHAAGRHGWIGELGEGIAVYDAPWGRVALAVGGDAIYPETFRLAAVQDVDVVAVPTLILEPWELQTGLLERSSENRMNLVIASRASAAGAGAIIALDKDFTLWAQWQRPFDGRISYPLVTRAGPLPGLTRAAIFPAQAQNRMISQQTNVVEGRPWRLFDHATGQ